ncbi:vacuolar protein sorting-associated protein 45 [Ceratobasidium sp. AG-Ba]|nr:vacuolar protein sorting-associated protein 45 [Ceratobasidium sp. AG-Ba]QRW15022.1 vacuolar protein sorting-associated protein 45 [Ceratobasidium sp. AG-Ba]
MDVTKAVGTYIDKMISTPAAIKVLLLDSHTTPIVSLSTTQSNLLSKQVYLTDSITNKKRDRMAHMKCVCFLRPNEDSLEALGEELKEPKYGEYYLYFSNTLSKVAIERLAEQDEYEVVREVQEYFADYAPVLPSLFSLNHIPKSSTSTSTDGAPLPFSSSGPLYGANPNSWDPAALERTVQGICAVLLSLKKKPVIRYERMSGMARKLGAEVLRRIQAEPALFDFRLTQVPPLLLLLDRRNDPVTPLLSQWTYQAMVHELLEIQPGGRVDLSMVPDIRPDLQQITLTPPTDPFFAQNLFANFGDLGATIQQHVQSYQAKTASQGAIESIADMKRFVEEYPEFRKLGGNVSKHVAVVGELSRLVGRDSLLDVSEVEQNLAGRDNQNADLRAVMELIQKPSIQLYNKIRLAIIYALRYQKTANQIGAVVEALIKAGASESDASLVYVMLNIAGADQRQDDLFDNGNIFSRGKSALKGLKGVENVYTQHSPHLSETLENLLRGRLKEQSYPFIEGQATTNAGLQRPQDVIVFMIGGTTYEEARAVALMNQDPTLVGSASSATRILLGGTCVHNSSSFLEMVSHAAEVFPPTVYAPPPESGAGTSGPSLNLNLGGLNVSVGGSGGTGVFRAPASSNAPIVSLDTGGQGAVDDGLREVRDGVRNFFGKVKQGVDRMGDQLR